MIDFEFGGGGIGNTGGTLSIANSTIYGNVDKGLCGPNPHVGGIVNNENGEIWLGSVTITNNNTSDASSTGGVFSSNDSRLYFFNTIIARNGENNNNQGHDCGGKSIGIMLVSCG